MVPNERAQRGDVGVELSAGAAQRHQVVGGAERRRPARRRVGRRRRGRPSVAATATSSSASTSNCWRHSRRNSRHAQRTTARPGGHPAVAGAERQRWILAPRRSSRRLAGEQGIRARTGGGAVDHAAVADEHHPVGPRRELRVVGHHHRGRRPRLQAARISRITASPLAESSAPVGSSASSSRRSPTTARAIATRCRSPPESWSGNRAARSARPSSVQRPQPGGASLAGRQPVQLQRQRHVLGRGQSGQQVEVLEHVPDRAAPQPGPVLPRHRRQRMPRRPAPRRRSASPARRRW